MSRYESAVTLPDFSGVSLLWLTPEFNIYYLLIVQDYLGGGLCSMKISHLEDSPSVPIRQ